MVVAHGVYLLPQAARPGKQIRNKEQRVNELSTLGESLDGFIEFPVFIAEKNGMTCPDG